LSGVPTTGRVTHWQVEVTASQAQAAPGSAPEQDAASTVPTGIICRGVSVSSKFTLTMYGLGAGGGGEKNAPHCRFCPLICTQSVLQTCAPKIGLAPIPPVMENALGAAPPAPLPPASVGLQVRH
jgi:hypothetical protein